VPSTKPLTKERQEEGHRTLINCLPHVHQRISVRMVRVPAAALHRSPPELAHWTLDHPFPAELMASWMVLKMAPLDLAVFGASQRACGCLAEKLQMHVRARTDPCSILHMPCLGPACLCFSLQPTRPYRARESNLVTSGRALLTPSRHLDSRGTCASGSMVSRPSKTAKSHRPSGQASVPVWSAAALTGQGLETGDEGRGGGLLDYLNRF
jgi:hypothetical protein